MAFWQWSRVANSNGTADSTIDMAEGMAPSAVNDGVRAVMARLREYGDDIAGAIVTGGVSTAYTVTTFEVFDTLPHLSGKQIAFTPHVTNGATVTLSVDGLTAKPLRSAPSTESLAGTLIQGTPYVCTYNDSDGAFYLQGFYGNAYNVPLGGVMPFIGSTAPNSSFCVLPYGQAISRTTYSALFSLVSTTYGTGDGSTTFNVPDLRGRVAAGLDTMGGSAASRLTTAGGGVDGATLGAVGGGQNGTILQANLPAATLTTTISDPGHLHGEVFPVPGGGASFNSVNGTSTGATSPFGINTGTNTTGITASTALGGSGTAFKLVQPTIALNFLLRIM